MAQTEMNEIRCVDLGIDCNFELRDHNLEELMSILDIHGAKSHGYPVGAVLKDPKVKAAVRSYRLV